MIYALHTATDYKGTPNQLRGCINDWKNFLQLDKELGIQQHNIISLVQGNYTRDNATQAVRTLAALMQPGDILIGSNAGHGIPVPDKDGDELDGKDQAIVTDDGKLILDDQIFEALKSFRKGVHIVAFLDNCHSGTMDRSFRSKNWHIMHSDVQCDAVMLFGCRQQQTAADAYIDGTFQGAMTSCALQSIRKAQYKLTYLELLQRTNIRLKQRGFAQIAQMAVSSQDLLHRQVFTI